MKKTTKRFTSILSIIMILLALLPTQVFASNNDSSLKTTNITGNVVNQNLFNTKQDVYIKFGSGLRTGVWSIKVTAPGGGTLGTGTVTVNSTKLFKLWTITNYSDTTNNGGEYKVEASITYKHDGKWKTEKKSDNFKVKLTVVVPPTTVPVTTIPATTVPVTTIPETTVPVTTVPVTTIPVTTIPETTVPESTVPESTVPESTVPESTVPESTVPESTVPESTVPESTVPENTVPSTTVPETTPVTPPNNFDDEPLAPVVNVLDEAPPLAAPVVDQATPVVEAEIPQDVLPLAVPAALPKTSELPATLFYSIGGLMSALGIFIKRR